MQELFNILQNAKAVLDLYYEIHKSKNFSNQKTPPKIISNGLKIKLKL